MACCFLFFLVLSVRRTDENANESSAAVQHNDDGVLLSPEDVFSSMA